MLNHVDYRSNQTVLKSLVYLLCFYIAFAPVTVFAATPEDIWLRQITKNVDSTGRTTGYTVDASKRTIVNGTARDMSSKLLDYKPNKAAVGGVMKKRLTQAAVGGGVAIIGVAAVDALLRGIGWIMEDGVYVKIKLPKLEPDSPSQQYYYRVNLTSGKYLGDFKGSTIREVGEATCSKFGFTLKLGVGSANSIDCFSPSGAWEIDAIPSKVLNPQYDPNAPPPSPQKTPITNQELEDIMFGDYAGDSSANIQPKNDGTHTGVQETMQPDPNAGEGTKDKPSNPVSNDIDQKLDANPNKTTKDHKSTDSKGDEETTKEDGTKEQTKTQAKTELPAFCDYAATLCKWIDWTQEEPEKTDKNNYEIQKENNDDLLTGMQTTYFTGAAVCPAAINVPVSFSGIGSSSIELSYQPLCAMAKQFRPAVILVSWILAAYIVTGRSNTQEG